MIMGIWHLSDQPENGLGSPHLHGEVEDWLATQIDGIPEEEWQAPDLAVTDPAGLTTFVAAFGLDRVSVADVRGMGRLAEYPGEMVFVGLAQKAIYVGMNQADTPQMEIVVDEETGIRTPRIPERYMKVWEMPETRLRLRGLVINIEHKDRIITYVKSRVHKGKDGRIDISL